MKRLRIEVSTVRPLYRPERLVEFDCVEQRQVLKWPEHVAFEDGAKIDPLSATVLEREHQCVWANDLEVLYSMDGVFHGVVPQRNGSILSGGLPNCKSAQSCNNSSR